METWVGHVGRVALSQMCPQNTPYRVGIDWRGGVGGALLSIGSVPSKPRGCTAMQCCIEHMQPPICIHLQPEACKRQSPCAPLCKIRGIIIHRDYICVRRTASFLSLGLECLHLTVGARDRFGIVLV